MNPTREFIYKRISEQFDYIFHVIKSDRSFDRKTELMESAIGVATNLVKYFPDAETAIYYACGTVQLHHRVVMEFKPKPKVNFPKGGVIITGDEIIIDKNENKVK